MKRNTTRPHIRPHERAIQLAADIWAEDIPPAHVFKRARVSFSTWSKWRRHGTRPWPSTEAKLRAALAVLIAERNERTGPGSA